MRGSVFLYRVSSEIIVRIVLGFWICAVLDKDWRLSGYFNVVVFSLLELITSLLLKLDLRWRLQLTQCLERLRFQRWGFLLRFTNSLIEVPDMERCDIPSVSWYYPLGRLNRFRFVHVNKALVGFCCWSIDFLSHQTWLQTEPCTRAFKLR